MMNMKVLAVETPPSIYYGKSTRKTLWEENFTLSEFIAVNMRNCVRLNVRKHREIKVSYKYASLEILLKFDSLDRTRSDVGENAREYLDGSELIVA